MGERVGVRWSGFSRRFPSPQPTPSSCLAGRGRKNYHSLPQFNASGADPTAIEFRRKASRTPSPPSDGGEGWGEAEQVFKAISLTLALSQLVPRREREKELSLVALIQWQWGTAPPDWLKIPKVLLDFGDEMTRLSADPKISRRAVEFFAEPPLRSRSPNKPKSRLAGSFQSRDVTKRN